MLKLFLLLILLPSVLIAEGTRIPRFNRIRNTWTAYPVVSTHDIQYCPPESLRLADSLQTRELTNTRWKLQASPLLDDTVTITALVIVRSAASPPHQGLIYTQHGWTMLLHDTSQAGAWAGIFVRVGSTGGIPDTTEAELDGFNKPAEGDFIRVTGVVTEFPAGSMNSMTQFQPIPGIAIEVLSQNNSFPSYTNVSIGTFYKGTYPEGKVQYSTGEQYEASLIAFRDVTVYDIVNAGRGTWSIIDGRGDQIADYDASYWWTLGTSETPSIPGNPNYTPPPANAIIQYLNGAIWTAGGFESPRGYRIAPIEEFLRADVANARIPQQLTLLPNYPNPFNPSTTISYTLPTRGFVTLGIFDLLGREITTLVNEVQEAGMNSVTFSANGLASGVYVYRIESSLHIDSRERFSQSRRMLIIK